MRLKTMKQLGKNQETFEVIGIGKNFLNRTLTAQEIIARINKWYYIKLKSFYTGKENNQ